MRKENSIIAIIGRNDHNEQTIRQLLEERDMVVEAQIPEMQEQCIIREDPLISELEEARRAIEKPLIPELELQEYFKTTEKIKTSGKMVKHRKKKNESIKNYGKPNIPRYHRRE